MWYLDASVDNVHNTSAGTTIITPDAATRGMRYKVCYGMGTGERVMP